MWEGFFVFVIFYCIFTPWLEKSFLLSIYNKHMTMGIYERYIREVNEIHNGKYDYSKFVYTRKIDKSTIICPEHGEFEQSMHCHLKGQGCPKCGLRSRVEKSRDTTESFITKAKAVHGDRYDYSKVEYKGNKDKVCIICNIHGEFWQTPNSHLNGDGCPECGNESKGNSQRDDTETFIEKARGVHGGKYDYSKVEYNNNKTKVCLICPEHGEFWQIPYAHLAGKGCPQCGVIKYSQKHMMTTESFIEKARLVHGDKYDYSKTVYNGIMNDVTIICPKHGEFKQKATYHLSGNGCQKCSAEMVVSNGENEMYDFITSVYTGEVRRSVRGILDYGYEMDIYIPELNLAFEYDGLYWHNEVNKAYDYHLKKTLMCKDRGIRLVHIFEDEWLYKRDIVESMIMNMIGVTNEKIYARKCEIRELSTDEFGKIMNDNHLQGSCQAKVKVGLFYNGELVSAMGFNPFVSKSKIDNKENTFELVRFVNKKNTQTIGGAGRLLKYFINQYKPHRIISYADIRWSEGNLYRQLGFNETHRSIPSYYYVINDKREYKFKYRKSNLIKQGYNPNKSEHEIMLERKIYRIYDCGKIAYQMDLPE